MQKGPSGWPNERRGRRQVNIRKNTLLGKAGSESRDQRSEQITLESTAAETARHGAVEGLGKGGGVLGRMKRQRHKSQGRASKLAHRLLVPANARVDAVRKPFRALASFSLSLQFRLCLLKEGWA